MCLLASWNASRSEVATSAVPAASLLRRDCSGEEVVGLVAGPLRGGEAHRVDEARQEVELLDERVVELASALIALERLVPVGGNEERVPADEDGARLLALP